MTRSGSTRISFCEDPKNNGKCVLSVLIVCMWVIALIFLDPDSDDNISNLVYYGSLLYISDIVQHIIYVAVQMDKSVSMCSSAQFR